MQPSHVDQPLSHPEDLLKSCAQYGPHLHGEFVRQTGTTHLKHLEARWWRLGAPFLKVDPPLRDRWNDRSDGYPLGSHQFEDAHRLGRQGHHHAPAGEQRSEKSRAGQGKVVACRKCCEVDRFSIELAYQRRLSDVIRIVVVGSGNQFGQSGGATGQQKHRDVIPGRRERIESLTGSNMIIGRFNQRIEAEIARVDLTAENNHMFDRIDPGGNSLAQLLVIEFAMLVGHNNGHALGEFGQILKLVRAVRR